MTPKELMDDVATMGFEAGFADNRIFYTAANRALDTLSARYPKEKEVTLLHLPPRPLLSQKTLVREGGTPLSVTAEGVSAYAFSASGGAHVKILADGKLFAEHKTPKGRALTAFYGNLPTPARCTVLLAGEGDYALYDLLLFEGRDTAGGVDAVFREDETEYRLSALCENVLSLARPPERADGTPLSEGVEYRLTAPLGLTLKNSVRGAVRLAFRLSSHRITPDTAEIDLREDAMHLLPTLTAAYAWLDADKEKAAFYLALFREAEARRQTAPVSFSSAAYGDVNGWA